MRKKSLARIVGIVGIVGIGVGSVVWSGAARAEDHVDLGLIDGTSYRLSFGSKNEICGAGVVFFNEFEMNVVYDHKYDTSVLSLRNPSWRLKVDSVYEVELGIDGFAFTLKGLAVFPDRVALVSTPEFLRRFSDGETLTVYTVSGETLARLSLDGSDKVVWAVAECNNRLQAMRALRAQEDPFSPPKDLKDKTTRPTRGAGRKWGS